ncbi:CcmD family protein [Haladaptatus paucihalophilus]
MEPLLIAGYSAIFLTIFGYVFRLQRRLLSLESQLTDQH